MKNRLLLSTASAALLLSTGWADTARAQAVYNWSGFYVGVNAGAAWGRSNANTALDCSPPSLATYLCDSTGFGAGNAALLAANGSGSMSATGFTGGIQAGYNWQISNFIYGLETDFGAFKLRGSRQGSGIHPDGAGNVDDVQYTVGSSFDTDWLFTFRGRFGWAVQPNILLFATGGLAATELKISNSYSDDRDVGTGFANASESKLRVGWVLGGGLEWALGNRWSVKTEYLYADFGKATASGTIINTAPPAPNPPYAQGISTSADLTAHIARIGVNYRF